MGNLCDAVGRSAVKRPPSRSEAPQLRRIVRDGFFVALLNPKTVFFFAAFLPQFVDRAGSRAIQGATLGLFFVLVALATDTSYVLAERTEIGMCRNIRTLFNFEPPATEIEIRAASLQFVRKISGFNVPSRSNEAAFDRAVADVAAAARALIGALVTSADPRDREVEATRARARSAARFGIDVAGHGGLSRP